MQLKSILTPERTFYGVSGASKKRIFQTLSQFVAENVLQFSEEDIYEALLSREKLGNTALGKGIAIPHACIENCAKATGALFQLAEPVDFDAGDGQAVDLVFVLLVPAEATDLHLQILSELAEVFSNDYFCQALRQAGSSDALFQSAIEQAEKILNFRDSA